MQISYSCIVKNDPEVVWDFLMDFTNRPQWMDDVKASYFTDKKEGMLGSEYVEEAVFLGFTLKTAYKVVAYEHLKMLTSKSEAPPFHPEVIGTMDILEGGKVKITLAIKATLGPLELVPSFIIKKQLDKMMAPKINKFQKLMDLPKQ